LEDVGAPQTMRNSVVCSLRLEQFKSKRRCGAGRANGSISGDEEDRSLGAQRKSAFIWTARG
jgi:hypothetical protein